MREPTVATCGSIGYYSFLTIKIWLVDLVERAVVEVGGVAVVDAQPKKGLEHARQCLPTTG